MSTIGLVLVRVKVRASGSPTEAVEASFSSVRRKPASHAWSRGGPVEAHPVRVRSKMRVEAIDVLILSG